METLVTLLIGILVTVAVYLLLSRNLIQFILGTAILSHAVHLLLITMGGLKKGAAPLLGENATSYTDALPHALILTAIVINFAVTAFILVLAYRTYRETKTDDLHVLRGFKHE